MTTISAQTVLRNYGQERTSRDRREAQEKRRRTLLQLYGSLDTRFCPLVKMHVGPWFIDPADGLPTRYVKGL